MWENTFSGGAIWDEGEEGDILEGGEGRCFGGGGEGFFGLYLGFGMKNVHLIKFFFSAEIIAADWASTFEQPVVVVCQNSNEGQEMSLQDVASFNSGRERQQ